MYRRKPVRSRHFGKESVVVKTCLELLMVLGVFAWRNNTGAVNGKNGYIRFGKVGSSDILGICPDGRFLAIECKRPEGGRLSPAQKQFISEIRRYGGVAAVVRSAQEMVIALASNGVVDPKIADMILEREEQRQGITEETNE